MSAASVRRMGIWGLTVELQGFCSEETAELTENFAGALHPPAAGPAGLTLYREQGESGGAQPERRRRPRHRGGSSARKFFLDGSRFDAGEQHRDIGVVREQPRAAGYAEGPAGIRATRTTATLTCPRPLPPMLLADLVEDRLLCGVRHVPAVQVHCACWLENGEAVLMTGDSGAGKTTALLTALRGGARFLGNDRAFLRVRGDRVEVRSFPLPVNVGCGTIRALDLDIPHHGLGDDDKIRLRPAEVVAHFGADYHTWHPVGRVLVRDRQELHRNIYWDEDPSHPFWVRPWHPGQLPREFVSRLHLLLDALTAPSHGGSTAGETPA